MTHIHKFKCLNCGLHFSLYSDKAERDATAVFCPECGVPGGKMHWHEEHPTKAIFQFVPGDTPLVGIA